LSVRLNAMVVAVLGMLGGFLTPILLSTGQDNPLGLFVYIALLDIGLPDVDGYELARQLRELPNWRNVKLLAVTGYGQDSDRARSQEAGFDLHLVKPISMTTLETVLAAE